MLILDRKQGQKILIPEYDIVITVVGIKNKSVSIGIDAPKKVIVDREEVHKARMENPRPEKTEGCCTDSSCGCEDTFDDGLEND